MDVPRLVDEAGFVFRGRAVSRQAGTELGPLGVGKTVLVEVEEILQSTDVMQGLVGTDVTVISEDPTQITQTEGLLFFTDCVSVGNQVVVRELGHREVSRDSLREVERALRVNADRPLTLRVAGADLIVTGAVTSARPFGEPSPLRSEHDPDWWIARIAVDAAIKGRSSRKTIEVLFANSPDIAWYKSPKLHEGASGIFILRTRIDAEAPAGLPRTVYQATDPLDFLPAGRLPEVRRLLEEAEGDH
jgi:hypothetical protein